MHTSYYAQLRKITNPVAISTSPPKWYTGPVYKPLAPSISLVMAHKQKEIDDQKYTRIYQETVLNHLNPSVTYERLVGMYGPDATLLCYERPGDFCHRRLVAEWFETELGIQVPELTFTK